MCAAANIGWKAHESRINNTRVGIRDQVAIAQMVKQDLFAVRHSFLTNSKEKRHG